MRKILNTVVILYLLLMTVVSCSTNYNITGTSIQSIYDGDMVYLRPISDDMKAIDSCKILHGKFAMNGPIDSVMCVRMFFGNNGDNIPVILEQGDISVVALDNAMKVEGTPLNDKFYSFMMERDSLMYLLNDLPRKEEKMILGGVSEDEILRQLGEEEAEIRNAVDKLETAFVVENYENVLGVTYFLVLCNNAYNQFGYATTTPQIDELYAGAPDEFKKNKDVIRYMNLCNGR